MPTVAELGYTGFRVTSWQGIFAPAGTPWPIVDRRYQETARALKMPDVIDRLVTQGGNELIASTPEEFSKVIKEEFATYAKFIKNTNISLE